MQTEQLHLPGDYGRRSWWRQGTLPSKSSVAWMLLFAVLGFMVISGLFWVALNFPRFGMAAAVAIVVIVPLALVSGAMAVPLLSRKMSSLWPKLRWWHALWVLLYVSTLVFRVRDQEATQAQPLDAWALLRIIPEMIVIAWLMARLYRRKEALAWVGCMFRGLPGALTIFALVCCASSIWSVYRAWTLYKSLEYLLDVSVLGVALANIWTLEDYEVLFDWTWAIFGVELAWVWLQAPLWPSDSFAEARIRGVIPATGSNAVGQSAAFFAVIALCRLLPLSRRRSNTSFYMLLFVFGFISLLISQTRNAVGAFLLAVVLVLILSGRILALITSSVVGALTLFFTPLGGIVIAYLQREQNAEAMKSLTGRAEVWTFALQQFAAHPLLGMGAYAAGRFFIMTKLGTDTATLHSDWIELLVGVGLAGLIPFVAALGGTWWFLIRGVRDRTLSPRGRQMAFEAVGVLTVITVHSFFNVELIWHVPLLLFVVVGYAELLRRKTVKVPRAVPRPVGVRSYSGVGRAPMPGAT
jgi:O-antigen ligase